MQFKLPKEPNKRTFTELAPHLGSSGADQNDFLNLRDLRNPRDVLARPTLTTAASDKKDAEGIQSQRDEALSLVCQTLDNEVGFDARVAILHQHGITDAEGKGYLVNGITPAQTQDIAATVKLYNQVQAGLPQAQIDSVALGQKRAGSPPVTPPVATVADLGATKTSDLRVADAGSGGAIMAPGFVAKVEPLKMARAAVETQLVAAEAFGSDAANSPLQFIPTTIAEDPGAVKAAADKLGELKSSVQSDERKASAVGKHQASLKDGSNVIHLAPRVEGTTLNNLKTEEKIALLKSPSFADDLGKASVMCPVLGLSDHIGPNSTKDNPTSTGFSNISNIMLDKNTGRLVAIDYAPGIETTSNRIVGYEAPDQAVSSLAKFVMDASKSPAAFDAAVDQVLRDTKNSAGNSTPISETMRVVLHPSKMDALFTRDEEKVVNIMVSDAEKRELIAQTLKGVVGGLEYVNQHADSLDQACHNSSERHKLDVDTGRNFVDRQQMANLKQGLGAIEFKELRANINAVSQGQAAPHPGLTAPSFSAPPVPDLKTPSLASSPWQPISPRASSAGQPEPKVQMGARPAPTSEGLDGLSDLSTKSSSMTPDGPDSRDLDERIAQAQANVTYLQERVDDPGKISSSSNDSRTPDERLQEVKDQLAQAEAELAGLTDQKIGTIRLSDEGPDSRDLDERIAEAGARVTYLQERVDDPGKISSSSNDPRTPDERLQEVQEELDLEMAKLASLTDQKQDTIRLSDDGLESPRSVGDASDDLGAVSNQAPKEERVSVRQSMLSSHRSPLRSDLDLAKKLDSDGLEKESADQKQKADSKKAGDDDKSEGKSLRSSGSWKSAAPSNKTTDTPVAKQGF